MKKTVLAVIACFVLIVVGLIPVWMGGNLRFERERYTADLAKFSASAAENGTLAAEVAGRTYRLGTGVLDELNRRLNYAPDLREALNAPPEVYTDKLVVQLGADAALTLYALDADKNDTAVVLQCEDRVYRFRLDDFAVYAWVERAVLAEAGGEDAA